MHSGGSCVVLSPRRAQKWLSGWRCRYGLATGKFDVPSEDVPSEFAAGNAQAPSRERRWEHGSSGGSARRAIPHFSNLAAFTSANSASGCATMVANMMPLMMTDQAVSQ